MKPGFLVIGCGKCGTTTLCELLARHPQIFVSSPKEPDFLSYDAIYARGWGWYESLFEGARGAAARGEGSVSYSLEEYEDRVCERILEHLPDVRLIYIVREPLSRLESVYREHHHSGHVHGWHLPFSIGEALKYRPAMLANTRYWQRISAFRRHFGDQRILVLFLEDLKADRPEVLRRCYEFLGVDSSGVSEALPVHLNPGGDKYFDTSLMRFIRTRQPLRSLWGLLPGRVQRSLQPVLRRRFAGSVEWDPAARGWALEQLADDARRFLEFYGKPADFWKTTA